MTLRNARKSSNAGASGRLEVVLKSRYAILIAALVLRLWFLVSYVNTHNHRALGAIPFLFEPGNIAFSLANGHGFESPLRVDSGPTAWMTPVYPGLLAVLFRVFGNYTFGAFLAAAGLNVLFSAVAVIPLYVVGEAVAGTGAAAIAGWLWAIFPNALQLPYEALWDACLGALLATALLWAAIRVRESGRVREWAGYGLLWGFALMTTAALGAVLPFLVGWAGWKKPVKFVGTTLCVAMLCCVPWTVRNYQQLHALVPLRTVMGLSMWLGNNDQADGIGTANLHPISNSRERAQFLEMGEVAYNAEKQRLALEFMTSHPAKAAGFAWRRFVAIWAGGSVDPVADFERHDDVWFRWVLGMNVVVSLSALAGFIVLAREGHGFAVPAGAFVLVFPLAYYITLAPPRYRHPIDPVLMLLAAVAWTRVWQTGRKSNPAEGGQHRTG